MVMISAGVRYMVIVNEIIIMRMKISVKEETGEQSFDRPV